ncbi:hypothetical protein THIX_70119 [Thiomonas sp. X19]|uniref:hypothetical protein n=1 Tax=Thiomonas sp. X19 TaxID=1050370 RepID=UPI000B6BD735|nr:hypothetical protein [Thiomonas sp. X19]SCC95090.1 hypothetical protein THIX_70119 [Thiomonas sp. X19]
MMAAQQQVNLPESICQLGYDPRCVGRAIVSLDPSDPETEKLAYFSSFEGVEISDDFDPESIDEMQDEYDKIAEAAGIPGWAIAAAKEHLHGELVICSAAMPEIEDADFYEAKKLRVLEV